MAPVNFLRDCCDCKVLKAFKYIISDTPTSCCRDASEKECKYTCMKTPLCIFLGNNIYGSLLYSASVSPVFAWEETRRNIEETTSADSSYVNNIYCCSLCSAENTARGIVQVNFLRQYTFNGCINLHNCQQIICLAVLRICDVSDSAVVAPSRKARK